MKYRDATEDNSVWEEGDWTCDGDWPIPTIWYAAFQTGNRTKPMLQHGIDIGRRIDTSGRNDSLDAISDDLSIEDAALMEQPDRERQDASGQV
ncbi:MAG: hypothetical protein R3C28_04170 [Pirellulaceae bacterium]